LTAASGHGFEEINIEINSIGLHQRLFGVQAFFELFWSQPMRRVVIAHACRQGRLICSVPAMPKVKRNAVSSFCSLGESAATVFFSFSTLISRILSSRCGVRQPNLRLPDPRLLRVALAKPSNPQSPFQYFPRPAEALAKEATIFKLSA
jgi:hypothetical protein